MSPHAACAARSALFSERSNPSWLDAEPVGTSNDWATRLEPTSNVAPFSETDLLHLAQDFLERSETLIDAVAPPAWDDEDDIFGGEVFDDERTAYQQLSAINPTRTQKEAIARELMANEADRYPGSTSGFLIALALTYRRILLDRSADPSDKVEILRRVYSTHEPQWMTAEIVYLHFVLLDQCRYLARASAILERKDETCSVTRRGPPCRSICRSVQSSDRNWSTRTTQRNRTATPLTRKEGSQPDMNHPAR